MPYKNPAIWFLFLILPGFVYAQSGVIKGTVLDGKTNQPLPYASVYFNYTTIGTYTDDQGKFILSGLAPGEYDLIVSYIGHQPYQKKFTLADGDQIPLTIRLDVNALKEVTVHAKRDDEWEKQLKKFKKLFLGKTNNAKNCTILNPWALTFQDTKTGIFIAQASEPLQIENLSLGYRISYQLKNFSVNREKYLATGFVRFEPYTTMDSLVTQLWVTNRDEAYQGSSRHLFKTMIEHCLKEESYVLYEDRSGLTEVVRNSRFLANLDKTIFNFSTDGSIIPDRKPNTWSIYLPARTEVHYKDKNIHSKVYWDIPYPVSWIEVKGGFLKVTDDGIVLNPANMTISGYMFDARIADILPNDYQPDIKYIPVEKSVEQKKLGALAFLTEKPYLQTDKSYYYGDEVIWFKGYMNYLSPMLKDSLSKVIYIDLLNARKEVTLSRILPIEDGLVVGSLTLPATIQPGDYVLRAYTRWMLNFDPSFSFAKPLKVLDSYERVKLNDYHLEVEENSVQITTDKEIYDPREKINVTLIAKDQLDRNIPASLSISVTDLEQAVPAPGETTILSGFIMPNIELPDTIDKATTYRIQHGFDFQGRFVPSKGKSDKGLITLVQSEASMDLTITTEDDGSFFIPNLLLYDTSHFSVFARTLRGRPGIVALDSTIMVPPLLPIVPLQLDIYKTETPAPHYVPDFTQHATLLKEVTVKATRPEPKRTSVVMADYEVTGEWLRDKHITDVLAGIQMRVPGLRIIISSDQDGFLRKNIILGGPSSFGGLQTQEPLVLIDKVVVNDMAGGPAEQISRLSPAEIESVEVTKYGNSAAYGARGGNGVISIFTRRGPSEGNASIGTYDKSQLQPIHTSGFSNVKEFIMPDYASLGRDYALPDYRSTIYWNPSVSIDGKNPGTISFYAADLTTQYRIVVEGITPDGSAIRGEKIISIRKLP